MLETDENDDLARLFAIGDLRTSDLKTACHSADDEIASAAFLALQLLGKSECERCADWMSQKHSALVLLCGANIPDAGFKRIEKWWAKKRTRKGYECGDDYEPLIPTPLDDGPNGVPGSHSRCAVNVGS